MTCLCWWRCGDSNSTSPVFSARGQRAIGIAACRFDERSVTALVHRCPWFANRLRTQHGPSGVPVPSGRGRLRRSGPPRPGTDRPAEHGKADPGPRPSRLVIATDDGGQLPLITARCRWVGTGQPDKPGGAVTVNQRVQRVGAVG